MVSSYSYLQSEDRVGLVRNDAAVAVGGATNEPRGGANGHDGQGALQSMPFTLGATIFLACTECGLNGTSSK